MAGVLFFLAAVEGSLSLLSGLIRLTMRHRLIEVVVNVFPGDWLGSKQRAPYGQRPIWSALNSLINTMNGQHGTWQNRPDSPETTKLRTENFHDHPRFHTSRVKSGMIMEISNPYVHPTATTISLECGAHPLSVPN